MKRWLIHAVTMISLLAPLAAWSQDSMAEDPLPAIQARWAEIKYQLPDTQKAAGFEQLVAQVAAARARQPQDVRLLIWEGISLASQAGAQGDLGALSLVKQARKDFEQALAQDPTALDGSAYTSLGSLYYQVPGWPLGFGDDRKAQQMLLKGLEVSPEGIDANFFYADYLLEQERYAEALAAFEKALAAPPRPGRETADAGRRQEIQRAIERARQKLG